MATHIINYSFQGTTLSNPDGSMVAAAANLQQVPGPGSSLLGHRPNALKFSSGSSVRVQVSPGAFNVQKFCIRMLCKVTGPVTTRQNLVESTALPFALFLEQGVSPNSFNINAAVNNATVSWTSATTFNRRVLNYNQWYLIDLVYDTDTLAIAVDNTVIAVTAFPNGGIGAITGNHLFIGTWVDGARFPFIGDIAGVEVYNNIPASIESLVDAYRTNPEWFITHKYNRVRSVMNFGNRISDIYYEAASRCYVQPFEHGQVMFNPSIGTAFEIHGAIYQLYKGDSNLRYNLGAIVSDELNGRRAGSKKSMFERGGLYWSAATGAIPVKGTMYVDYELIGEGASAIGLPIEKPQPVTNGFVQRFQAGKMYYKNGMANAFEVHGAILAKFDATGGLSRWGFPVSHECDVKRGTAVIGKFSQFEVSTFFWSGATGAHVVYGAIREEYMRNLGGPSGIFGFPTSSEEDIPGVAGPARYNTFQNGTITWFNGQTQVCYPFKVSLGSLDTKEEDRDIGDLDGQNDLYAKIRLYVNDTCVYDKKIPEGTKHFPSSNRIDLSHTVPYRVIPNSANTKVRCSIEVWECDEGNLFAGGDDLLGTYNKEFSITNGWGFKEQAGLFSSGAFGAWVNNLNGSVKPDLGPYGRIDFYNVTNAGTPTIDYREYAEAFADVDPDFEVSFGIVDDALKALYYELFVKGVASGGNCYGMSLEAIYAYKGRSRLSVPLQRFNNWSDVENDFNVKHAYQCGSDQIGWFVVQFLLGRTHDPITVFNESFDAFSRGLDPLICIAQNYDFSGRPHCILPREWYRHSATRWEIKCFDPNYRNTMKSIFVNPSNNSFCYEPTTNRSNNYYGDAWSGGRFHFTPFNIVNHKTHTLLSDLFALVRAGLVVFVGDAAETTSITDENGVDLNAFNDTSRNINGLKRKFVPVKGVFGSGAFRGEMFVRQDNQQVYGVPNSTGIKSQIIGNVAGLPRTVIGGISKFSSSKIDLNVASPFTPATINNTVSTALNSKNFIHNYRGKKNSDLQYVIKQPMLSTTISAGMNTSETGKMEIKNHGSIDSQILVHSQREKKFQVTSFNQLGVQGDELRVTISNLPVQVAKAMEMNIHPGLQEVDILGNIPADADITIEAKISGKKTKGVFRTKLEGKNRIVLTDYLNQDKIKVGRIDNIFGNIMDAKVIRKIN